MKVGGDEERDEIGLGSWSDTVGFWCIAAQAHLAGCVWIMSTRPTRATKSKRTKTKKHVTLGSILSNWDLVYRAEVWC